MQDLVPLLDVAEQRLALLLDDFDLLRERTEPLANFAEMPVGLALVRVLAPEHARDAERAQPLERIADVLHERVLLALRTQLRELAIHHAQMVRETAELGLDAVDLLAQRLFCDGLCC